MPKPVKDLVRHQKMEMMPAAPPGTKKHWNAGTQTVSYVPKTAREVAREAIKPPPKPQQTAGLSSARNVAKPRQ